jgi:hypothetical protein
LAFKGATTGVVAEAILNRAPEPLRHLVHYDGSELERIVNFALQKDRNLRYQSAAGICADLIAYKVASLRGKPRPLHGASLSPMRRPLALKKGFGLLSCRSRSPRPTRNWNRSRTG